LSPIAKVSRPNLLYSGTRSDEFAESSKKRTGATSFKPLRANMLPTLLET